jgi:hypothetical protein
MALAIHAPVKSPATGRTGSILIEVIEVVRTHIMNFIDTTFSTCRSKYYFSNFLNPPVRPLKLIVLIQKICTRTINL